MHRVVSGLVRAKPLPERPRCIPKGRAKGVKAKGLTYERAVGKRLAVMFPALRAHQWFYFVDSNGPGYCQTDYFVQADDRLLLFECKLTETPIGLTQMDLLYRPVLELAFGLPVVGVMVCKHLTVRDNPRLIGDLRDVSRTSGDLVWHLLP